MAACGYRLGTGSCRSDVIAGSIAIPLFENASQEPRLENLLTEAFRDRIQALPCVSLSSRAQAEALLTRQRKATGLPHWIIVDEDKAIYSAICGTADVISPHVVFSMHEDHEDN